jgi:general stress protein 26
MVAATGVDVHPQGRIERLLDAALQTLAEVPYCWVITPDGDRRANARAVKAFPNAAGEDPWTRWFLTMRTGRKSSEIRVAGRVTLAYQHASGNAYVMLAGPARIIDEAEAVEARLLQVDDPEGTLVGKLVAVRVDADHLELHVRGTTAEPWGHGRTLLERDRKGVWQLVA